MLVNWIFLAQVAFAAPLAPYSAPGHTTFQQFLKEGQKSTAPHGKFVRPTEPKPKKPVTQPKPLPSAEPATMQPISLQLSSTQISANMVGVSGVKPLNLIGNDGRLEVRVPAGAFDLSHAQTSQGTTPAGPFTLRLSQVHGHATGLLNLLGAYQIQVLDGQHKPLNKIALRVPLTIIYHYQLWELQALDLNPAQIFLSWPGLIAAGKQAKTSTAKDLVLFTNNAATHTLTAQTSVIDTMATLTVGSEPANQSVAPPHFATVQGNSGNAGYTYPLQIAPAPAGFAPTLQLVYSSGDPNGRHSQTAAASDVGDGWAISLGSITETTQANPNGSGTITVYSLSGVDNVSDRLVPDPNNSGFFLTEHLSRIRIHQRTSSSTNQICFHVWDLSGNYYEFGCTPDSLQYYTTAAGRVNYRWDLDLERSATDGPNTASDEIVVHYLQDIVTVGGYTSIRDAALEQVQYGTLASNGTTFTPSGTVDFHYHAPTASTGHDGLNQPWAVAYPQNYNCATTPPTATTLRCDDPLADGSVAAPSTMSTMTLDTIETFVGSDTSASHLDYAYALAYNQDTPFATCQDPNSGVSLYCAGEHTLASITPSAYLQGTAHQQKPTVFTYTSLQNSYYDSTQKNQAGSPFSDQVSWAYLTSFDDLQTGVGEQISYATAWNNTHGTPTVTDSQGNDIDDHLDPLFCDHYSTCTGTYAYPNDQAWTVQVVTQIQSWGKDSNASALAVSTTTYRYSLGYYGDVWTPSGDVNWLNYYDGEYRGMGTVYTISSSNDLTVDHYYTTAGVQTSPTMAGNYLSGELQDEEIYSGNSTTGPLLQETDNVYAGDDNSGYPASCILTGIGGYLACESVLLSHKVTTYNGTVGNGAPWIQETYGYDDFPLSGSFNAGTSKLYHNMIEKDISGSNLPSSIYPLKETWTYAPNDQDVNLTTYYDVNKVASSKITDASGHIWQCTYNLYDEGVASGVPTPAAGMLTKQQTYSSANCSGQTSPLTRDYTGYDAYGNVVATVDSVGTANKPSYASVGCTLATAPVSITGAWPNTRYTTCTSYDSLNAVPTTQKNALGQTTTTTYDQTQQDQPISVTNPNSQTATEIYSYDSNGNSIVQEKQPLENGSYTSQSSEASSCSATSTLPCYESDTLSSLYSNAVTRTFYDSQGRVVETRSPGATPGDDTVVMTVYNDQNHTVWKSVPFQVAHGSGWIDPNGATDINGNAPAGTITFYDALDRVVATQYPNYGSSQEPGLACSTVLSGTYTACTNYSWGEPVANSPQYELATSVDPNGHETQSFTDAQGNVVYANAYSGVYGGALTLVKQTQTQYNALNKPTSVTATDEQPQSGQSTTSVTTTMTYDDLGRLLTVTDPDQGTLTYSYDPDGHISSVVQTAGSNSRTLGYNYDLLGRMTCEQTAAPTFNTTGACSAGSPLVQNTYDTTKLGTQGSTDFPIGQLTQSVATTSYPDGSSATVTEQFQHDQRGRLITEQVQLGLPSGWGVTSALPAYQETMLYNDADQVTTTSTNASGSGYTFTQVYDATNGTLQGLSNNGGSTANLATLTYNEYAQLGSITQLNGAASSPASLASETFNYDANLRPLSLSASWLPGSGNNGLILSQGRTYDNASNVTSVDTTFAAVPGQTGSGGSETQNFCYDEQNRLIWSGNAGTQPSAGNGTCGSGTLNSGLSGASYTAPYTYTNLGQIWSGPLNGQGSAVQYLYCNSSAPHQLTGIYPAGTTCANKGNATATYSASYDPWGNLTSRTYNGVTATLSYDALNRLTEYNAGSSGQEFYLYDASGNRILKRSLSGGSTTLAIYLFGLEEYHYSGSGVLASQLHYYSLAGHLIGATDGTTTTFYLTDALGSVLLSFSQNAILGEQIYGPYGASRYMAGNITTAKGYTGQFHDAVSGLDYYNARYYDPVVGRFLSVDSVQGNMLGFDPYAYVSGNPETMSDPTGHWSWWLTAAVAVVVVAAAVVTAPFWAPALLPTVAAGAVVAACSGTVATVAGGAIGGAIAGGGSAVVGDLINESHGTPLSLDQLGDDAGKGALLGELAGGIGQLAMPGIAAVSKFVASGISDTTLATSVANSTQGCLNTLYQTTLYGTTTWAGYAVTHPKQAFGAAVNEDKQTAKALHMSYDHYKKFQHANAVALDKQFTDEQQHYVQRWHSFLISMRSQSRGQAYTPRQEAMINQWRHAYYA